MNLIKDLILNYIDFNEKGHKMKRGENKLISF